MTPPDLQDYDFADTDVVEEAHAPEDPEVNGPLVIACLAGLFAVVCFVGLAQRWGWWS